MKIGLLATIPALVCLTASGAFAGDQPTRLLLLSNDPALAHAVSSALGPWGVTVVPSDLAALGPSMPLAATDARTIAEREHVDGVAWVSRSDSGTALWTYDVHTEQTVSRPLTSAPPYDEALAASVALSLKTLLRSTEVAPKEERVTQPAAPAAPEAATTATPTPAVVSAPAERPRSRASRASNAPRPWLGELGAGARFGASSAAVAEPRLSIVVGYAIARWTLGLGASFGAGATSQSDAYSLHLSDTTVGLLGRLDVLRARAWSAGVSANVGAHVLVLSGDAGTARQAVNDTRLDVSVGAGLFAGRRLARSLMLGASVDVDAMTLRQRFYVAGALATDEGALSISTTLWLRFQP